MSRFSKHIVAVTLHAVYSQAVGIPLFSCSSQSPLGQEPDPDKRIQSKGTNFKGEDGGFDLLVAKA